MSLRHAILGFLALKPMSGYDLRKTFDASVGYFWPADQAQIYRTLAKLVDDGLVTVATEEQAARPNRRIHTIHPAGLAALDAWLAEPVASAPAREPFLLKLFLGGRLGAEAMQALLEARVAEMAEMIASLEAIETATLAAKPEGLEAQLRLATLENGLAHARTEQDWALTLAGTLTSPRSPEADHG